MSFSPMEPLGENRERRFSARKRDSDEAVGGKGGASFLARVGVNRLDYRPVKRTTFLEFSEHWKKQVIELLKPSTAKAMASHLRFHLVPAFGATRLDEIGQEQAQAFVGKLAKDIAGIRF